MSDCWIQTYPTGLAFDFEEPHPSQVRIEDIAHSLSHLSRFNGYVPTLYSVAQHSVLVSEQLPDHLQLQGLLHDAHEAYVGDVSQPLKRCIGMEAYRAIEYRAWEAVSGALGVPFDLDPAVKEADARMLTTEKVAFGKIPQPRAEGIEPYPIKIVPLSSVMAKALFLERYHRLRGC